MRVSKQEHLKKPLRSSMIPRLRSIKKESIESNDVFSPTSSFAMPSPPITTSYLPTSEMLGVDRWNITRTHNHSPLSLCDDEASLEYTPILSSPPRTPMIRLRDAKSMSAFGSNMVSLDTPSLPMKNRVDDVFRTPESIRELTANIRTPMLRHIPSSFPWALNELESPLSTSFPCQVEKEGTSMIFQVPLQTEHPMKMNEGKRWMRMSDIVIRKSHEKNNSRK
jgi:hypothetical protein